MKSKTNMRKRLSEIFNLAMWKQWFSQKVQPLQKFIKSKIETKTKKSVKKTTTTKKTAKVKSTKK